MASEMNNWLKYWAEMRALLNLCINFPWIIFLKGALSGPFKKIDTQIKQSKMAHIWVPLINILLEWGDAFSQTLVLG